MAIRMHHVGLRVSDLERSTRFYREAFGARIELDAPVPGDTTEQLFGAEPGTTSHVRGIIFDEGAIEIFAFDPSKPTTPTDQTVANQMHLCLYVDDVHGVAARIEAAGGSLLFPPMQWGEFHFVYTADPDGNVIELLDASQDEWLRGAKNETQPESVA
jgi:glyoxylase I family protein